MTATNLRRLALAGLATAGLAAVAAPAASADTLGVRTFVEVVAPYDTTALGADQRTVDEAKGPVMLHVRHTIRCIRGKVRRRGYPETCQWSSTLDSKSATVSGGQGRGDVYATGFGRPQGENFHAGTATVGRSVTDDWNVVVRGDAEREIDEVFRMSVTATDGGSVNRFFTILDDESRR